MQTMEISWLCCTFVFRLLKQHVKTASENSICMKTAAGNALYTSKTVQNEMITVCRDLIRKKILEKIQTAGFFSVIADDATDTANGEQLLISIRFVDNGSPCEISLLFMSATLESAVKPLPMTS